MPVQVQLPPGCSGLTMEDGTRYSARKGSAVMVEDHHAGAVQRYSGGDAAILNGRFRVAAGTKDGRWCPPCGFLAQSWSRTCPKCGGGTIPEAEMPEAPPSPRYPGR